MTFEAHLVWPPVQRRANLKVGSSGSGLCPAECWKLIRTVFPALWATRSSMQPFLTVRNFFLMSLWNFPCCNLQPLFLPSAPLRRIWLRLLCNTPLLSGRLQLNSSSAFSSPSWTNPALLAYLYIRCFHTLIILMAPHWETFFNLSLVLRGSQNWDSTPDANSWVPNRGNKHFPLPKNTTIHSLHHYEGTLFNLLFTGILQIS